MFSKLSSESSFHQIQKMSDLNMQLIEQVCFPDRCIDIGLQLEQKIDYSIV